MPTPIRLRDFIRNVRTARTAAKERELVNKECANIRSSFREENNIWRCRSVAKLLYIHILGYPAHFGQMECLKLIASQRFTDKRIGYLGSMLLLDERQDIHLLITNSLKKDLNSPVQFVVGLALCTLGVISSPEMCKDLAGEIEKLLKEHNVYVKKKAALCAFRIVRKVPEMFEIFIPVTRSLLSDKNHAVLLTAVVLITEMCHISADALHHFKKLVTNLIRVLKHLIMSGYSPEHDVCGVIDPFLQVKVLKLLRLLGTNDAETSETMNDIFAQVATNTETTRNVGCAVLYETIFSIMSVKSERGLRTLGINMLGRFLLSPDRNIRYVALNTLLATVKSDYNAVQRHRYTIIQCLKDSDTSIKKCSLELCFALVNSNNIRSMTTELLAFMEEADPEFKSQCSYNLFICAERYASTRRWHVDTMIKVLTLAGNHAIIDVVGNLIQLISQNATLHAYTVQLLWKQLKGNLTAKQPLVQVAAWSVGEYGDLLISSPGNDACPAHVSADDVIDIFEKITSNSNMSMTTKQYSTTTLMKLSVRYPDSASRIKLFLDTFGTNVGVELQQRAVEFSSLCQNHNDLRFNIFERMPVVGSKGLTTGDGNDINLNIPLRDKNENDQNEINSFVLDLLSDNSNIEFGFSPSHSETKTQVDLLDLLGDLEVEQTPRQNSVDDLLDDVIVLEMDTKRIPPMTVFDKSGLKITFEFEKQSNDSENITINAQVINYSLAPMVDFLLQVAVPKGFKLEMFPPSNNILLANRMNTVHQTLKISNPKKDKLRLKLRMSYISNGNATVEQVEVNNIHSVVYS